MNRLRWPALVAVLVLGAGVLAASLRGRSLTRRIHSASSSRTADEAAESGPAEFSTGSASPQVLSADQARHEFARAGVTDFDKRAALRDLSRAGAAGARRFLEERLRDKTEEMTVRTMALALLPSLAKSEGTPAEMAQLFSEMLSDSTFRARYLLVKALGEIRDPAIVPPLLGCLRSDPDPSVRIQALRSLDSEIARSEVIQAAQDATISDPSENVRLEALRLVLTCENQASREFASLVARLDSTTPALRALAQLGARTPAK